MLATLETQICVAISNAFSSGLFNFNSPPSTTIVTGTLEVYKQERRRHNGP
nr:MAG TPA: hypothetical protein [Caudoviricetes sp.]